MRQDKLGNSIGGDCQSPEKKKMAPEPKSLWWRQGRMLRFKV